ERGGGTTRRPGATRRPGVGLVAGREGFGLGIQTAILAKVNTAASHAPIHSRLQLKKKPPWGLLRLGSTQRRRVVVFPATSPYHIYCIRRRTPGVYLKRMSIFDTAPISLSMTTPQNK